MEVEVAVRLLYMLGEALPASHGAHFTGDTAKTSALQDMMRTVSLHATGGRSLTPPGAEPHAACSIPSAGVLRCQQLPALLRLSGVLRDRREIRQVLPGGAAAHPQRAGEAAHTMIHNDIQ